MVRTTRANRPLLVIRRHLHIPRVWLWILIIKRSPHILTQMRCVWEVWWQHLLRSTTVFINLLRLRQNILLRNLISITIKLRSWLLRLKLLGVLFLWRVQSLLFLKLSQLFLKLSYFIILLELILSWLTLTKIIAHFFVEFKNDLYTAYKSIIYRAI